MTDNEIARLISQLTTNKRGGGCMNADETLEEHLRKDKNQLDEWVEELKQASITLDELNSLNTYSGEWPSDIAEPLAVAEHLIRRIMHVQTKRVEDFEKHLKSLEQGVDLPVDEDLFNNAYL